MTASDSLSRRQVGHLLENEPEGFSVRAYEPGLGERAKGGYVVAMAGQGQDYTPAATADQGMEFIASREAELRPEGRVFGGWTGKDPSRTALDVSQLHPPTFTGHVTTAVQAASSNQEAFGLLDATGTEYTNFDNPSYDPKGGHAERNVSLTQMGDAVKSAGAQHPTEGIDQPAPSRGSELTKPSRVPR